MVYLKFLLLISTITITIVLSSDIKVLEIRTCAKKNYTYQFSCKFRPINDDQQVSCDLFFKKALDNDNKYVVTIDRVFNNGKTSKLTSIKGEGGCKAIQDYAGPIMDQATKAANMKNECPYSKGKHHADWFTLDIDDIMVLKIVPRGKFKVTIDANSPTNKDLLCVVILIEKK